MSIKRMKKLRLIVCRAQRDELMRALMRLGCVQLREPEETLSDPEISSLLRRERVDITSARTQLSSLRSAIAVLEKYAPSKKKLLSARPQVAEQDFLDGDALKNDLASAEEINRLDSRIRRTQAEEARLRGEIESLLPWESLDIPLEHPGTKTCGLALFGATAEISLDSIVNAAEAVTEDVQILPVSEDEAQNYFAALAMNRELPEVTEAIRSLGCSQVGFQELIGTPRKNIDSRRRAMKELIVQREELSDALGQFGSQTAELRLSADRMAAELGRLEAVELMAGTDSIVLLEGWFPEDSETKLKELLNGFDCGWEFSDPTPEEYPDVPVSLKNKRFVSPMNLVTEMYALPAYDGIDPNPLMLPFFVLFYGIMMADMGYGLLMMLVSLLILRKTRPSGGAKNLLSLMGLCGISTFVMGALTGGFFGDFLPQLAKLINPDTTFTALPALFAPLNDTIAILLGALALGIVQIFTGMTVSVIYKVKNGDTVSAVFEEGSWWFILFGIAFMVLDIGSIGSVPVVLVIGCAMLVTGQFVMKKSFIGGITGLFGAIYNGVTGYFSDILSYSRLMALMLAGSVIATVFNTLGAVTGSVIIFVLISFIGNMLNFALNLLGCFVHDLRLQVLEFFGRFYKDGGKPFRPLFMKTNYVDIIKEDN